MTQFTSAPIKDGKAGDIQPEHEDDNGAQSGACEVLSLTDDGQLGNYPEGHCEITL